MRGIIKYRWPLIIASFLLTTVLALQLKNISIDPDLKNYFPETMESMVATNRIEEKFGNQDIVMIIFKTENIINANSLKRIKNIDRGIGRINGIRKTNSLFSSNHIYGKDGIMYVEPAIKRIPRTLEETDELKETLAGNELVMNIVVADDFRSSAIIASLAENADEDSVFMAVHSLLEEYPGKEDVFYGGLPYLRQEMNKDIKRDALILVPAALLLMTIFLFFVFREPRGVIMPFLVVIMSTTIALSLIPLIGWQFYFITLLVPIMLIAIANDYGIHIMAKYQEINAGDNNHTMKEIALIIAKKLWRPIVLTGITTIAGIMALLAHTMIPARQMALIAGIGIVFALVYSIVLLPAILSLLKPSKPLPALQKRSVLQRNNFLNRLAFFITSKYRRIPVVALILTIAIGTGIAFLKVDSNEENFFLDKHPVKQGSKLINSKYGGSENLSILFEGDMLDPAMLGSIESYEKELLKVEEIDLVMSFPDVIKEISKALYDPGDPLFNAIPPMRNAVAQFMELYSMNGNTEDLDQLVDFGYEHSHMLIRINSVHNKVVNNIIVRIKEITKDDPHVTAVGGYGFVRSQLASKVVQGQFYSLSIAMLIVFIILSVIFKSLKAGMISIIPLGISIIILFGLMGITGVNLDVATALLSSIMIGVGVDYTIHFLWRYREERQQHRPKKEAVITTLTTTGRGIIFNAFSVIVGFIILIISSFTPIRFFGILVVVSIFSCLAGALVVLPALVLKYKFKFLEPVTTKLKSQRDDDLLEAI
ncbi:MAG: MMPL family transporter [Bacteroidales bacterium]|nr:MMPL family transporter [Bacteroidales bacterium]